jgi:hypothetical protein
MAEYDFHFTAEVMDGIFGEVITARGAWDTLGERLDNMEQGTGDTYTKAEVDTMLAEKVDKVTGKGLSTNDFTNPEKEQIETNKNNISSLWDVGAKNTFNISATPISENVTYSISGGSILVQSTGRYARIAIPYIFKKGTYIFTSTVSNLSITGGAICIRFAVNPSSSNPVAPEIIVATNGDISKNITINADTAGYVIYYINTSNTAFTNSATFSDNMIRLASIDDINYQPYAPTNRELYEMILSLQSGT